MLLRACVSWWLVVAAVATARASFVGDGKPLSSSVVVDQTLRFASCAMDFPGLPAIEWIISGYACLNPAADATNQCRGGYGSSYCKLLPNETLATHLVTEDTISSPALLHQNWHTGSALQVCGLTLYMDPNLGIAVNATRLTTSTTFLNTLKFHPPTPGAIAAAVWNSSTTFNLMLLDTYMDKVNIADPTNITSGTLKVLTSPQPSHNELMVAFPPENAPATYRNKRLSLVAALDPNSSDSFSLYLCRQDINAHITAVLVLNSSDCARISQYNMYDKTYYLKTIRAGVAKTSENVSSHDYLGLFAIDTFYTIMNLTKCFERLPANYLDYGYSTASCLSVVRELEQANLTPVFYSGDIDAIRGRAFLGTRDGMAFQINLAGTNTIVSSFIVSNSELRACYADPYSQTTLWLTRHWESTTRIQYELLHVPYELFTTENMLVHTLNSTHDAAFFHNATAYEVHSVTQNSAIFLALNSYGDATFAVKVKLSDCSRFKTCADCLNTTDGDPYYCAWNTYYSKCFAKMDHNIKLQRDKCPELLLVTPAVVPNSGNAIITIIASESINIGSGYCSFAGFYPRPLLPDKWVPTKASCAVPALELDGATNYTTAQVTIMTEEYVSLGMGDLSLTVMNCHAHDHDCQSCKTYCTYDPSTGKCGYLDLTANSSAGVVGCPVLRSISPPTLEHQSVRAVTITANAIPGGAKEKDFLCHWTLLHTKSTYNTEVTRVDPPTAVFECNSPSVSYAASEALNVSIIILSSGGFYGDNSVLGNYIPKAGDPTADYILHVTAAGCPTYTDCASCHPSSNSSCTWCVDSDGASCKAKESCSTYKVSFDNLGLCPSVVSVVPQALDALSQMRRVNLTLSGPIPSSLPKASYTCTFTWGTNGAFASAQPGVITTGATVSCLIPTNIPATETSVSIKLSAAAASYSPRPSRDGTTGYELASVKWQVFACNRTAECTTCFGGNNTNCFWCMAANRSYCTSSFNCSAQYPAAAYTNNNKQCPKVSTVAPSVLATNPGSVLVTAPGFHSNLKLTCMLKIKSSNGTTQNLTVGTYYNATAAAMVCPFPEDAIFDRTLLSSYEIYADLYVYYTASRVLFTPAYLQSLRLVDCGERTDLVCSKCLANERPSECSWNTQRMRCEVNTDDEYGDCPVMLSVDSNLAKPNDEVKVYGTRFDSGPYTLYFGSKDRAVNASYTASGYLAAIVPASPNPYVVVPVALTLWRNGKQFGYEESPVLFSFQISAVKAKEDHTTVIVAIVVPVGVCLLLLLILIVVVVLVIAARRGKQPGMVYVFDESAKPESFEPYQYDGEFLKATGAAAAAGGATTSKKQKKKKKKHHVAEQQGPEQMLLNTTLARAVCEVTQATEADKVSSSLIYVNAGAGRALQLLDAFLESEVANVPNETLLFRANSFSSKMFRTYSKMVGIDYLWSTLAPILGSMEFLAHQEDLKNKLVQEQTEKGEGAVAGTLTTDFELDPTKMQEGMDEATQSYMLAERSRTVLVAIMNSDTSMPASLKHIVHCIRELVTKKFPDAENIAYTAVGGVIFLRFICPAITVPHAYGLLVEPPTPRLQRQLVLLSKVMQNLANCVLFGGKEPFMKSMNEFIAKNFTQLQEWMDKLADSGEADGASAEENIELPRSVFDTAVAFLVAHVQANGPKIQRALEAKGESPEIEEARGLLEQLLAVQS
eukprot:TRINITY_DN83_c0_g1_i3.p1 TRINITY_DN83_c0_g1~~TRINITY_DN83_c0_g1_i3.p1  ORF type:complete len:1680 (-),score=360.95 TRINITY_DN83_c0_g1_i3:1037-6076(-)